MVLNTDVKIDGVVYKGVTLITPTFESDIPKYKVDQGFSITDHIGILPIKFDLDLKLYDKLRTIVYLLNLFHPLIV